MEARLREADVHGWLDGWDWAWMTFMMAFWLVILGALSTRRCVLRSVRRARPTRYKTAIAR